MRGQNHVLHVQQRTGGSQGFRLEDVQPRRRDPTFPQRPDQGLLVHDRSPAGVDEHGVRLHRLQLRFTDQVPGTRIQGRVQGDEIGLGKQALHLDRTGAFGPDRLRFQQGIAGQDPQLETLHLASHATGDAAEADQAQGVSPQMPAMNVLAAFPASLSQGAVMRYDLADHGKQQTDGMVGHFVEDGGGGVGDNDALPGGRLHRNVVETASCPQDGSTARQLFQALSGDDRIPVEPDHVGIGRRPQQFLSGSTGVNPQVHPRLLQVLFDPGGHRNSVRLHVDNG